MIILSLFNEKSAPTEFVLLGTQNVVYLNMVVKDLQKQKR